MSSAWPKVSVGSSPEEFAWHLQDAAVRCSAVLLEVSLSRGHQKHTSLPAITPGGRTMRRRCRSFHCRASLSPSRTGAQNVDACYQHSYKTLSRGPCTIASWPVAQIKPLDTLDHRLVFARPQTTWRMPANLYCIKLWTGTHTLKECMAKSGRFK